MAVDCPATVGKYITVLLAVACEYVIHVASARYIIVVRYPTRRCVITACVTSGRRRSASVRPAYYAGRVRRPRRPIPRPLGDVCSSRASRWFTRDCVVPLVNVEYVFKSYSQCRTQNFVLCSFSCKDIFIYRMFFMQDYKIALHS